MLRAFRLAHCVPLLRTHYTRLVSLRPFSLDAKVEVKCTEESVRKPFKAETKRLMEIVANSLYSEKEVFIRELASNAADACEKFRYLQLTQLSDSSSYKPLGVHITLDAEKKLFIIQDTGLGMTASELEENLGTIAMSGAQKFLDTYQNKEIKHSIIGQFGVGFYSAFTVGYKVDVYSKSYLPDSKAYLWQSEGLGDFTLAELEDATLIDVGTKIVVHLKPEDIDYSDAKKVESIIKKYSNFLGVPVYLNGHQVNTIQPLWTLEKSSVSEEQYNEFYKFIADSFENPKYRLHYSSDAPVQIKSLLFIPSQFPMGLLEPEENTVGKISLYSKRVLIKGATKDLLPHWLGFIHGVVESEDIPLNLSRELLQNNVIIQKIKRILTGRVIKWLKEEMAKNPEEFSRIYHYIGRFIKTGVLQDQQYKQDLLDLLLFDSSFSTSLVTLKDYVSQMPADQNDIYVFLAKNRQSALQSPYFEVFADKNRPVLFVYDHIDDYLINAIGSYENKKLVRIDEVDSLQEKTQPSDHHLALSSYMTKILGTKVKSITPNSDKSSSYPALIRGYGNVSSIKFFQKFMAMQGQTNGANPQDMLNPPVDLDIQPDHPIIKAIDSLKESKPELADDLIHQIFDQALLEAGLLEDTQLMVKRMNRLLSVLTQ